MSIEQTPPNLDHTPDNEAVEDRISDDRISDDIDRIHALCEILEPSFEQIEAGVPIEDASLRDKFTELTVLLAELHPADVAAVLESLPPRERNIVWLLVSLMIYHFLLGLNNALDLKDISLWLNLKMKAKKIVSWLRKLLLEAWKVSIIIIII